MKLVLLWLMLICTTAMAQNIELVVPYSSGGPTDIFGRSVQKYLTAKLDRTVVVVNKPGADGRIGINYVQSKPADATTLIVSATGPFLFNKVQYKKLNYDYTEFDMVVPLLTMPMMVAVNTKSHIHTFADFIKEARATKMSCGVSAASSGFAANYIKQKLALTGLVIVPYKGVGDILISVMGNNIDCIIDAGFKNAHQDARVRVIAIADDRIDPDISNADLIKNYIPGYTQSNWWGNSMLKTNVALKDSLATLIKNMGQDPEYRRTMHQLNFNIVTPQTNYIKFLDAEYQKYDDIRKSIGEPKID